MSTPGLPYYELSKRETNDLFRLVEQGPLPIVEFDLLKVKVPNQPKSGVTGIRSLGVITVTTIRHRSTRSYYGITKFFESYESFEYPVTTIHEGNLSELFRAGLARTRAISDKWVEVLSKFSQWLDGIRKYVEYEAEPDLWSELAKFKQLLTVTHSRNTPFDRDEQAAISVRIQQAKEYVQTSSGLTRAQISRIEARLDHAEEASERIGRKDWLMMVTGSILGLVLTDTITPQVAEHIIMLIVYGISHFFGYSGPPPQLP